MKLQHLVLTTLVPAALCISADAAYITIYDSLEGGSGDVDSVLYHPNQTGTTVDATLNTSGKSFAAEFTSMTSLSTQGGQASLKAADGTTFTDLCFMLLNDYTFTKLILNPDASQDGEIEFTVEFFNPDKDEYDSMAYTLNGNGQNYFTVLAGDGALISKVCWTSNVGVVDAKQYRVGGLHKNGGEVPGIPDGGTTLASLGLALLGLGSMRRFLIWKA